MFLQKIIKKVFKILQIVILSFFFIGLGGIFLEQIKAPIILQAIYSVIAVAAMFYLIVKTIKSKDDTLQIEPKQRKKIIVEDINPKEYKLFYNGNPVKTVAGTKYRIKNAIKWASGQNHTIYPELEPNNKYDEFAIAVYGKSTAGVFKLGYIDADTALELHKKGIEDKIKLVIENVKITDKYGNKIRAYIDYKIYYKI